MTRPRAHIRLSEKLASALADKLPQDVRDDLRARRVPAEEVIRLFTPDHIQLHAWGGPDLWWNLDMRVRGPELKAKDNRDTSRAAKAVRIDEKHEEARRRMLAKTTGDPFVPVKPRRKIARHVDPWGKKLRAQNKKARTRRA